MGDLDRRSFLRRSAGAAAGTVLIGGTAALGARTALDAQQRRVRRSDVGYGPLVPVADSRTGRVLLHLPEGFTYTAFGLRGDPMSDGVATPSRHDGMAAFATDRPGVVRLVRNHERGLDPTPGSVIGDPATAYDPLAGGGTTTLTFDTRAGVLLDSVVSLNGTSLNCAGGPTPWGSWLTCEETNTGRTDGFEQDHGYVFEVPADGRPVTDPQPYRAMGRFRHEAVAVDPTDGTVYETEDDGNGSGLYRFVPRTPGRLGDGGVLQMLAVRQAPGFDASSGVSDEVGRALPVHWVTIADPEATGGQSVFAQGRAQGGASFARLEGAWYDGGSVFVSSTTGGDAGLGQVWEYRPGLSGGELVLVFESPSSDVLQNPDNITVSPRRGLVLCEDGSGDQYVRGLDQQGRIFDLALDVLRAGDDAEFAGACFSPEGDVLFVNLQTPGITVAIRGPWDRGPL